jgi:LPS-assembly protein
MTYSLCPIGNTDWQMKADKVTLNPKTNYGIAKNVTIEFMGIPIDGIYLQLHCLG